MQSLFANIFTKPYEAFDEIKEKKSVGEPLVFFSVFVLAALLLDFVYNATYYGFGLKPLGEVMFELILTIPVFALQLGFLLVGAAMLHLGVIWFIPKHASFKDSLRISGYTAPVLFFYNIVSMGVFFLANLNDPYMFANLANGEITLPLGVTALATFLLSFAGFLHYLYVAGTAVMKLHGTDRTNATLSIVLPPILVGLVAVLVTVFVLNVAVTLS